MITMIIRRGKLMIPSDGSFNKALEKLSEHDQEVWMRKLGTGFVDVWFYVPRRNLRTLEAVNWLDERHVADPKTLVETVNMSMVRLGARYALHEIVGGKWRLYGGRQNLSQIREYPTREAAEMVAIHGG